MTTYPEQVRKLNDRMRADLGANPLYSWRWSDDLLHVMTVIDPDTGKPKMVEAVSEGGLTMMVAETQVRQLLPDSYRQWILCALVEVDHRDGSILGTGSSSWVPISSSHSGCVSLPTDVLPTMVETQSVIDSIRNERKRRAVELGPEWEEIKRKQEKAHWNKIYDQIRDSCTAFYNVPGAKGHVSFPSVN